MFQTLQPSARRPPSAKNRHWISRTPIIVRNPAHGPSRADSIMPPHRCPDEPVPGIVKLIICAANTNAPMTPITGIFFSSFSILTLWIDQPAAATDSAPIVAATPVETSASAMCMMCYPLYPLFFMGGSLCSASLYG